MATVYKSLSKTNGTKDAPVNGVKKNKQRVLILSSRGVTYRHRHLLNDLHSLLPHSRKDAKLDTKTKLHQLNELADLYNCNNVLFFEARKAKDLYIWISKAPNGPTVKFHLQNLHTMSELHFPGNCLRGSRPILSFSHAFTTTPHLSLIKELLTHTFAVPPAARKSKPFIDHVLGFTLADDKIWIRVYQINETELAKSDSDAAATTTNAANIAKTNPKSSRDTTKLSLTEIGPRFVLTPIVILEGSFGGPVIYENKEFVSPNLIRAELRRGKAARYARRAEQDSEERTKKGELGLKTGEGRRRELDELDVQRLFA
ncbi:Ribosome biogenesis protein brx1 [Loxospora ochrophaea]|nr:Ribosome biogenesis protein brx1 [Loxospora ochrophaea]